MKFIGNLKIVEVFKDIFLTILLQTEHKLNSVVLTTWRVNLPIAVRGFLRHQ